MSSLVNSNQTFPSPISQHLLPHAFIHEYPLILSVAFPHLYNSLPHSVKHSIYHLPQNVYIWMDNSELPPFHFNSSIPSCCMVLLQRMHHYVFGVNGADDNDFKFLEDVAPFLKHKDLENDLTADSIALWWAPEPYSHRSSQMRCAQDIPLVMNWYLEQRVAMWIWANR